MFVHLVGFLKRHKFFLYLFSIIYNLCHLSLIHNVLQRGVTLRGSFLNRVNISVSGHGNLVVIGEKTMMNHCEISVMGHNCRLIIVGGGTIQLSYPVEWL